MNICKILASAFTAFSVSVVVPFTAVADVSGTLIIAENETPENLDPANATNSTVNQLLVGVYDALVQFKAGETSVSPQLATDWQVSENGLQYTFNLRDDVKFHDGSSLTAHDVVFTLDRLQAASAAVLNDMGPYKSAKAIGDYTIEMTLDAPFGPFISALSRIYIVSKQQVEPHMSDDNGRGWLAINAAASGPYKVSTYKPTEVVTLNASEDYWGGWDGDHVAEVVFRYISEPSTQLALLKSGEVHIAPDITVQDKLSLMQADGFRVDIGAAATPLYFQFNTSSDGLVGNSLFRNMLAQTFDRKLHLDYVLQGFGAMPDGPLPPDWMGHSAGTELPFNLAAAKKLVDQNGWAGTTLKVRYLPAIEEEQAAVEQLQSNLSQIGIKLEAEGMTWPAQASTVQDLATTSDINMIYNFPSFPDPHAILNTSFNTKNTGFNGGYNWAQYSNSEVDVLLNEAASSADQNERAMLYAKAQKIIGADYPVITVSLPGSVVAMSDAVKGYTYSVAHHQTFNYMDIAVD
jgi:peptide/nickel transport system substrate-binding protein